MASLELDSSALSRSVAFTGRLACMTRAEAFGVVRQHGGTPSPGVTKQTNVVVVGELGWPLLDDGRPSNKLTKAASYGIPLVSERQFLEWIGKAVPENTNRTYSSDQIAALSNLPIDRIHELGLLGLLDERAGRFGFRDLASARQIAKLLAFGVALSEIIRSVTEVRKWLPVVGLAHVRFHPGPQNSLEVEQSGRRTDKRGQFVLPVDHSEVYPDDLFDQAVRAEETGNFAEAERLYRMVMKRDPVDAAAPFNLGNLLRSRGGNVEAEAAFRAATQADPTFGQAWYNLADLLDEQGRTQAAIECLGKALQAAPGYVDACFNLALLLQRTNRLTEAADYWRRYLAADARSEWAARARRSLKFCEMQINLAAS
jgi:tetratricopeptide (TPR) repeat protein